MALKHKRNRNRHKSNCNQSCTLSTLLLTISVKFHETPFSSSRSVACGHTAEPIGPLFTENVQKVGVIIIIIIQLLMRVTAQQPHGLYQDSSRQGQPRRKK